MRHELVVLLLSLCAFIDIVVYAQYRVCGDYNNVAADYSILFYAYLCMSTWVYRDEPGFLKVFNGDWAIEAVQIEGKPGSKVVVQQQVLPSIVPPGPLGI